MMLCVVFVRVYCTWGVFGVEISAKGRGELGCGSSHVLFLVMVNVGEMSR